MRNRSSKLSLHRETLRRLTDRHLAEVAGGTELVQADAAPIGGIPLGGLVGDSATKPRSNAWTGGEAAAAYCS